MLKIEIEITKAISGMKKGDKKKVSPIIAANMIARGNAKAANKEDAELIKGAVVSIEAGLKAEKDLSTTEKKDQDKRERTEAKRQKFRLKDKPESLEGEGKHDGPCIDCGDDEDEGDDAEEKVDAPEEDAPEEDEMTEEELAAEIAEEEEEEKGDDSASAEVEEGGDD